MDQLRIRAAVFRPFMPFLYESLFDTMLQQHLSRFFFISECVDELAHFQLAGLQTAKNYHVEAISIRTHFKMGSGVSNQFASNTAQ
jgi:hypothetical protein